MRARGEVASTSHIELEVTYGLSGQRLVSSFYSFPLPNGGVCISDCGGQRVLVLSADGATSHFGCSGEFKQPRGLALATSGTLLVADNTRVHKFDEEGAAIRSFGAPAAAFRRTVKQPRPADSWIPHSAPAIGEHDASHGPPPMRVGSLSMTALPPKRGERTGASATTRPAYRWQPSGVAFGPGGRIYVSDKGHDRILCFRSSGAYAYSFGSRGSALGELRDPRGLAVHAEQVWVADMCNHRLSIFSVRGRALRHIGRFGVAPGEFRHPVGVAIVSSLLLVSEYSGGRVQVLTLHGACLQAVRVPFGGACLGALGADTRLVTVTDSCSRLHCFSIQPHGTNTGKGPLTARHAGGVPLTPSRVCDVVASEAEIHRARIGRVELALQAADYRCALQSLTRDDLAAIVPAAHEHSAAHAELYNLPPVRSVDELVHELCRPSGAVGPPH